MSHEAWIEIAESYALGVLDPGEKRSFEAHLADGCHECREHVDQTLELLAAVPGSLQPIAPSTSVKTKLFRRIEGGARIAGFQKLIPQAAFGLAGFVVAGAAVFFLLNHPLTGKTGIPGTAETSSTVSVHDAELTRILSSPELRHVELKSVGPDVTAAGQMAWNPKVCRGCFKVKGLTALQANKIFQLWAIYDGKPVSVGIFSADKNGEAHVDFPALSEIKAVQAFAVTIEPQGGMPQPTGPMALVGNL